VPIPIVSLVARNFYNLDIRFDVFYSIIERKSFLVLFLWIIASLRAC